MQWMKPGGSDRETPTPLQQRLRMMGGFLRYLAKNFVDHQGGLNAAALTYTTLFAVVPLMTVSYTVLASVPSFQGVGSQIEELIFSHFLPSSGAAVRDYLSQFASQARTLTVIGIGFLVVTAILMMRTIEGALNRIWQVTRLRRGVSSFLLYWAVLSLGPLLLGLGFVLTSYLASLPLIGDAASLLGGQQLLLSLLPFITSGAAFSLIYMAVPNCPVSFRDACVGGFTAALVFELAKQGFTFFVTSFPSYELIYGAFAAVPMFLAWIYISWLIILLGAELVRALSTYSPWAQNHGNNFLDGALLLLERLWQAQRQGEGVRSVRLLKLLPKSHRGAMDTYLHYLINGKLVKRTDAGTYVLSRDLHRFTLGELCQLMPGKLPFGSQLTDQRDWGKALDKRLQATQHCQQQRLEVELAALFDPEVEVGQQDSSFYNG